MESETRFSASSRGSRLMPKKHAVWSLKKPRRDRAASIAARVCASSAD
jgi:hypothetical protein